VLPRSRVFPGAGRIDQEGAGDPAWTHLGMPLHGRHTLIPGSSTIHAPVDDPSQPRRGRSMADTPGIWEHLA